MAKGNVKKGFATYLVVLFMAIVAAFFILVAIMLFSPFKSILGFKYFSYSDGSSSIMIKEVEYSPSTKKALNFSEVENISIECGFSTVRVLRESKDGCYIQIDNKCAGFAREDMDTDFVYEVKFTDKEMKNISIKVREPEGFVYFNKGITISLIVPEQKVESFENTNVDINSTDGTILIGNQFAGQNTTGNTRHFTLAFKSLSLKNTTGKILVYEFNKLPDDKEFVTNEMFIKTNRGNVEVRRPLSIKDLNVYGSKANFAFSNLSVKSAKFDLGNSDFSAGTINIDNTEVLNNSADLMINGGYFTVNTINGVLTSNEMTSDMGRATIKINKLNGSLSLPNVNNSRITIAQTSDNSQIYIRGKGATVNLNRHTCKAWIEITSGKVNVTAGYDEAPSSLRPFVNIKTTSGSINMTYNCGYLPQNGFDLLSTSGSVNLKVRSGLSYTLNVVNTSDVARNGSNVSVEGFDRDVTFPLVIKNGADASKTIKIMSNSNVKVSLI